MIISRLFGTVDVETLVPLSRQDLLNMALSKSSASPSPRLASARRTAARAPDSSTETLEPLDEEDDSDEDQEDIPKRIKVQIPQQTNQTKGRDQKQKQPLRNFHPHQASLLPLQMPFSSYRPPGIDMSPQDFPHSTPSPTPSYDDGFAPAIPPYQSRVNPGPRSVPATQLPFHSASVPAAVGVDQLAFNQQQRLAHRHLISRPIEPQQHLFPQVQGYQGVSGSLHLGQGNGNVGDEVGWEAWDTFPEQSGRNPSGMVRPEVPNQRGGGGATWPNPSSAEHDWKEFGGQ
jgi:hypothetical protein